MSLSIKLGFNPIRGSKENITDDLVSKIKERSKDIESKKLQGMNFFFLLRVKLNNILKKV